MIDPRGNPSRPRLSTAVIASTATTLILTLAASAANGQNVSMPAPSANSPRPVWNCRAQQAVGGTKINASRQLDATGASLSDGAGWTDVHTADAHAPLTVSVNWHPQPKPMNFAEGMATFYFRIPQSMTGPITLRLSGAGTFEVAAGQSYDNPHHFSAYERIGKVLAISDGNGPLKWTLRGKAPGQSGAPIVNEGAYPMADLGALKPAFAGVLTQLDALQADFARRCRRL